MNKKTRGNKMKKFLLGTLVTVAMTIVATGCSSSLFDSGGESLILGDYENASGVSHPTSSNSSMYYPGGEIYGDYGINAFISPLEDSLSTFGLDVDNASYTLMRGNVNNGVWPNPASVRVEEFVNFFDHGYEAPTNEVFAVHVAGIASPFRDSTVLLRVGLKARDVPEMEVKPWNLTLLVDVSGSMGSRMHLVKASIEFLVEQMGPRDLISITTYAGSVETKLRPTGIADRDKIFEVVRALVAGGATAMGDGLNNAYKVNREGFLEGGVNRVVVFSDGDANLGNKSHQAMLEEIAKYLEEGITMTTLGFGSGNYNGELMEQLANQGNGNYYYIDQIGEAKRIFGTDLLGTMQIVAKDAKIQVSFQSDAVRLFRLLGYENRKIAHEDFAKEDTDAGEVGSGHEVTAIYELVLQEQAVGQIAKVDLRYKAPEGGSDRIVVRTINVEDLVATTEASNRIRFISAVVEYAEILRNSPYAVYNWDLLEEVAKQNTLAGNAKDAEFIQILGKARAIQGK
jgi:Ca-activated chloride channel homolog